MKIRVLNAMDLLLFDSTLNASLLCSQVVLELVVLLLSQLAEIGKYPSIHSPPGSQKLT